MKIIDTNTYRRCINGFSPIQIISKYASSAEEQEYIFQNREFLPIGRFRMKLSDSVCFVSDLFLSENVRNKKTGANAIISMRNFIKSFAEDSRANFVQFCSKNNSKIKRLYEKLGGIILEERDNRIFYYIPVTSTQESLQKEAANISGAIKKMKETLGFRQ